LFTWSLVDELNLGEGSQTGKTSEETTMKTRSSTKKVGETLNILDDLRKSLKPNIMDYSLGWK